MVPPREESRSPPAAGCRSRDQRDANIGTGPLAPVRAGDLDPLGRQKTYPPIRARGEGMDMKMSGRIIGRAHHGRGRRYDPERPACADPVDMAVAMHHDGPSRDRPELAHEPAAVD